MNPMYVFLSGEMAEMSKSTLSIIVPFDLSMCQAICIWTLAATHTGVVQNKSIACQADRFLLDGK
jgi:hypothetical protein